MEGGFPFAIFAGSNSNASARRHHTEAIHGKITDQNNGKNPKRDDAQIDKNEKGEVDKHFVGQRVEEGAEIGDDFLFASPFAVDEVGQGGNNKNDERSDFGPSVGQKGKNYKNDRQKHAQDR